MNPVDLGKRIERLRRRSRLTQAQLSESCGIDPQTLSRIERGLSVPSLLTFFALSDALRVTPRALVRPAARASGAGK